MDYIELIKMENLMCHVVNIKNPTICDAKNLRNLSKLIQNVRFEYGDYRKSSEYIDEKNFCLF